MGTVAGQLNFDDVALLGQIAQIGTQSFFSDGPNSRSRNAKADPAFFVFQPKLLALKVREELATGLGIGVGNVIARNGLFSRQFAYSGHDCC